MRLLTLLLLPSVVFAADINANSCSQADVSTALTSATTGDRILVPAGTCTWSNLSISKAVHLKGAGIDVTVITVSENTITKQAAGIIRITDFTFTKSNGGNVSKAFVVNGSWTGAEPVIFANNKVTINDSGFFLLDVPGGVIIANNDFQAQWDDSVIQLKATNSQGSWETDDTFGAKDVNGKLNHYIETNTFYGGANQAIDCDDNTRCVYRYNAATYSSFNSHGYATSPAGARHFEIYNNQFLHLGGSTQIANQNISIWLRGATGFIYNNYFDDIAGSYWGDKEELRFTIRGAEDARPQGSCASVSYPVPRQIGQNHNGTAYFTDPVRWYNNTGTLAISADWNWGNPCGLTFSDFWQAGRDYIIGSAKPGYVAYTYPHPLLGQEQGPSQRRWRGVKLHGVKIR